LTSDLLSLDLYFGFTLALLPVEGVNSVSTQRFYSIMLALKMIVFFDSDQKILAGLLQIIIKRLRMKVN